MNAELLKQYKKARALDAKRCAYYPHGPLDALRFARCAIALEKTRAVFPVNLPDSSGEEASTELCAGLSVVIRIEYDNDHEPYILEDSSITWVRYSEDGPHAFRCPDAWLSRDGTAYGSNARGEKYRATFGECSGYGLAEFYKDARYYGMPRNDATLYARAQLQGEANRLSSLLNERYGPDAYGYTVTLQDADGKHSEHDSCWGFDDFDYCVSEAETVARSLAKTHAENIRDSLPAMRLRARKAAQRVALLTQELKLVSERVTPNFKRIARVEVKAARVKMLELQNAVQETKTAIEQFKLLELIK